MTPVELNLFIMGRADGRRDEQRLAQANIYSLAALIRAMIWGRHPPSFERVFPEKSARSAEMTDTQMYLMVRGLNAMFGGESRDR